MKKLLINEKLPYFFTILIGLATYQINNIINTQIESPILTFSFKKIAERVIDSDVVEKELECELENINYKKAFRNLDIYIAFRTNLQKPIKINNPTIVAVAPSKIIPDTECENIGELLNRYKISVIHPDAKYILKLTTQQNTANNEYPKLFIDSRNDVRLVETDFLVKLLKNQVLVNVILLLCWVLLIILYLWILTMNEK